MIKSFQSILDNHLQRYARMKPSDVYKLIHQACMGSEHAVLDPKHARERLFNEISSMGSGPPEPLVDPVDPAGNIIRIHLRPFCSANLDPEILAQAFIETSCVFVSNPESLRQIWRHFHLSTLRGLTTFHAEEVTSLNQFLITHNFPAIHHSSEFAEHYRPAYRVIDRRVYCPK